MVSKVFPSTPLTNSLLMNLRRVLVLYENRAAYGERIWSICNGAVVRGLCEWTISPASEHLQSCRLFIFARCGGVNVSSERHDGNAMDWLCWSANRM